MVKTLGLFGLLVCNSLYAQLTPEQKAIDFQTIASLYSKQYAPYEWKRDNFQFDLLDLRPWLPRIRQSRNDLEYLDIVSEYTARLQDVHSYYVANSDFAALLPLIVDIYDGKVLVEDIDRRALPAGTYDFQIGDEIVQFDGRPVMDVVNEIAKLNSFGNPRSTQRWATDFLTFRIQAYLPSAALVKEDATLLINRADGSQRSYTMRWSKFGTPLLKLGPQPNFRMGRNPSEHRDEPVAEPTEDPALDVKPHQKVWAKLQNQVGRPVKHLRGFAARDPIYRMPSGFVQRLGRNRSDFFHSGTYTQDGKRIGFIRIHSFMPVSAAALILPLRQFESEIAFMRANTDALVVDVTRNEGGFGCYAENLLQYLIPRRFNSFGSEIRPSLPLIQLLRFAVAEAEDFGDDLEAQVYKNILKDLETAYSENRGRTGPLPLCTLGFELEPARDRAGTSLAYDKPVLLLTDEFSTSAAEIFAAVLQDNGAAKLFGYRTAGAGGTTDTINAGFFSEGAAAFTQMLVVRPQTRQAQGFPASRYIENVGVHPDIPYDYQTRENLMNGGLPFSSAFFRAAANLLTNP